MNPLQLLSVTAALGFFVQVETASAVEFEKLGEVLKGALGTTKPMRKIIEQAGGAKSQVFYSKDPSGKAARVAVVETGLYPPDCTHTWVVSLNPTSGSVEKITVIEMKCQHAFPCRANSFLDQYKGAGPANAAKLKGKVNTIAKATGTSDLTTLAVQRAVSAYQKVKGSL